MISARPLIVIADYGSNKDKSLPMVRSSTGYSSIISKYTVMKSKNVNFLYSFTYWVALLGLEFLMIFSFASLPEK